MDGQISVHGIGTHSPKLCKKHPLLGERDFKHLFLCGCYHVVTSMCWLGCVTWESKHDATCHKVNQNGQSTHAEPKTLNTRRPSIMMNAHMCTQCLLVGICIKEQIWYTFVCCNAMDGMASKVSSAVRFQWPNYVGTGSSIRIQTAPSPCHDIYLISCIHAHASPGFSSGHHHLLLLEIEAEGAMLFHQTKLKRVSLLYCSICCCCCCC